MKPLIEIILLGAETSFTSFEKWIRKIPFGKQYLFHNPVLEQKEVLYFGERLQLVTVHWTREELERWPGKEREYFLQKIIQRMKIQYPYFSIEIQKLCKESTLLQFTKQQKSRILYELLFIDIWEQLLKENGLMAQECHLWVFDDGKQDCLFFLHFLEAHLGYVCLITERPDYFVTWQKQVYEQYGLVIECNKTIPIRRSIDLLLDFHQEKKEELYEFVPERTVVFDMGTNEKKRKQFLCNKKKKWKIWYDIVLTIQGQKVEARFWNTILATYYGKEETKQEQVLSFQKRMKTEQWRVERLLYLDSDFLY